MAIDLPSIYSQTIENWVGIEYKVRPFKANQIAHVKETTSRTIDMVSIETFGLPEERYPMERFQEGHLYQSYGKRFTIRNYGLMTFVAFEDWDDDQNGVLNRLLPMKGGAFARAFRVNYERTFFNMLSTTGFASGTSVTGSPDGVSLCNTAHPVSRQNSASTTANRPATDTDLSYASLTASEVRLSIQPAENNIEYLDNEGRALLHHPNIRHVVKRLLTAEWVAGTANRDANTIRDMKLRPVETPYFQVSGATGTYNGWMLFGEDHHVWIINRQDARTRSGVVEEIGAHIITCSQRMDSGWSNFRGVDGSKGG